MGRKVFVSYRYADTDVAPLNGIYQTKVRNYVDRLEENLGKTNVYKGEHDGEDMSAYSESTIEAKLKDKIYDSTVTIVLLSPGMRDSRKPDSDQWIPWEISYSIKKITRGGRTSQRNAVLAVILPDRYGGYGWYDHANLFDILQENIRWGYIPVVKWQNFQYNRDEWIDKAISARDNTSEYLIQKEI